MTLLTIPHSQIVFAGDKRRVERIAGEWERRGRAGRTFDGSLTDAEDCAQQVAGAETLVYFAPVESPSGAGPTLDAELRGLYLLLVAALDAGVRRFVVVSTLRLFSRVPANYLISPLWRPYPTTALEELIPFLSELCVREMARTAGDARTVCLRVGDNLTDTELADAVFEATTDDGHEGTPFRVLHRGESSRAAADSRSWREALFAPSPSSLPPPRRVVIFGAGGPVGRALADELQNDYILRLTDARPLAEIEAENRPQNFGAPVARPLPTPHENVVVDVTDPDAVAAACEGMDAIVNLSVVREDIPGAFAVNLLGANNVIKAAVTHGIRRVVHTGPQQLTVSREVGYHYEHPVPGDAPARPGRWVYTLSKFLGQEVIRIFAERHGLSVPCLLFNGFLNATQARPGSALFVITWADSARALRAALEVPSLPSPFEVIAASSELPSGGPSPQRAKELLNWEAQDDLSGIWR